MTTKNRFSTPTLLFIITAAAVVLLPLGVLAFSGSGAGTSGDPYQITTCLQLQEMSDEPDAHYILANNIDCSDTINWNAGEGFIPIKGATSTFAGTFTGQGFEISNLYINRPSEGDQGLFGGFARDVGGVEINNVNLINVDIKGFSGAGALVGSVSGGSADNDIIINNVFASGSVVGEQQVGGLIGFADAASDTFLVSNSGASVDVGNASTTIAAGGLIGNFGNGVIENSYATGNVIGRVRVGGLAGDNLAEIRNSYSTGNVFVNDQDIPDGFEVFDGSAGGK